MAQLGRILSRATAKPYTTGNLEFEEHPFLNENGYVDFKEGDIENPHNWSNARRWYITICSVLLLVNATFASSSVSGCLLVSTLIISSRLLRLVECANIGRSRASPKNLAFPRKQPGSQSPFFF